MHDIVIDQLENHLNGTANRAFYDHLKHCSDCNAVVGDMESVTYLIRELRPDPRTAIDPPLGFYHRVAATIVERQQKEAFGLFSPGRAFFRRVAFASLLLLAGLGSFLVSRESSFASDPNGGADAAAIMAQHDPSVSHPPSDDRDRMLVTLATYNDGPDQ